MYKLTPLLFVLLASHLEAPAFAHIVTAYFDVRDGYEHS